MIHKKCACMLLVDIWVIKMKEEFAGLEPQIKKPDPRDAGLKPGPHMQNPGFAQVWALIFVIQSRPR